MKGQGAHSSFHRVGGKAFRAGIRLHGAVASHWSVLSKALTPHWVEVFAY